MNIGSHIRLCIFDVDGTLVKPKSITTPPPNMRGGWGFRQSADDWEWLPGRLEKCHAIIQRGISIALATNQGGVAFGHLNEDAMNWELRSEEHTSELQSHSDLVCRLLLEKKKKK